MERTIEEIRADIREAAMAGDRQALDTLNQELRNTTTTQAGPKVDQRVMDNYNARINQSFSQPAPEDQEMIETRMPRLQPDVDPESGEPRQLTKRDLIEDPRHIQTIRKYMHDFEGVGPEISDEEVVDQYLMRMRYFAGGNSVTTLNEIFQLQKADDTKKATAGQAYDLFDQMAGVWSDEYTWGEMFGGLGSYARAAILDPINLVGVGIGKAATTTGARATSAAAKNMAVKAAKSATQRALAKGATKEAAEEVGRQAAARATSKLVQSAAFKSGVRKEAIASIAIATGVDATTAVGVDYAYQWGLMETGQQEEWSPFQSGLTALGAIGAPLLGIGLEATGRVTRDVLSGSVTNVAKSNRLDALNKALIDRVDMNKLKEGLSQATKTWDEKVAAGVDLEKAVPGTEQAGRWQKFLLGDDEVELKGLYHHLHEAGFRTLDNHRFQGDNFVNQVGDMLKMLPEDVQKEVINNYKVAMKLPKKKVTIENVADALSTQAHRAGQELNFSSQGKHILEQIGLNPEKTNAETALRTLQVPIESKLDKIVPRKLAYFQTSLIQTIVSHPATTALNVIGSTYRGGLEMLSDVVRAGLYSTYGARGIVTGNWDDLNRGIRIAKSLPQTGAQLLKPEATLREFDEMMTMRPEVQDTLFRWLSGGVDAQQAVAKQFNIDPKSNPFVRGTEAYKNFAQKAYLVQYQDRVFKGLNFMRHLNRNMMEEYGMSYSDFMNQKPDWVLEQMNSARYVKMEVMSTEQAMESVFAKSYSSKDTFGTNPFHAVATWIEEARKIPVVGAMVPFGQFFNNTIDLMADYTPIKFVYRLGRHHLGQPVATGDELIESMAKAAVGAGVIVGMGQGESENIDQGLAWNQERDSTGQVRNYVYDFPESFFKMAARMYAHTVIRKEEIPPELFNQAKETFGLEAFTRGFEQPFTNLKDDIVAAASEPEAREKVTETFKAFGEHIGAAWISGYSRPIDPINQFVGATKEGGQVVLDRKQGEEWLNKSFRYVDQMATGLLKGLGAEEKNPTFEGEAIQTIGKATGYRTVPELSPAQKMFNSIERPYYMDGVLSQIPEADNRVRQIYSDILDENAIKLMRTPNWNNLRLPERTKAIEGVIDTSAKEAQRRLRRSLRVEDMRLSKMYDIQTEYGVDRIDRAFSNLGLDEAYSDLSELDLEQLRALELEAKNIPRRDRLAPTDPYYRPER